MVSLIRNDCFIQVPIGEFEILIHRSGAEHAFIFKASNVLRLTDRFKILWLTGNFWFWR